MDESQGEFDFSTRQKVWSVGEFTRQVRGILESTFDSLQVRGQIGNITRAQSGHIYMNLVDDEDLRGMKWTSQIHEAVVTQVRNRKG